MEENHRRRRTISSSLGNVTFDSKEQRVLTVEDPTMDEVEVPQEIIQRRYASTPEPRDFEQVEQEIDRARREQRTPRATSSAINRLELLTGIGRLISEITIEKVEFKLRSLKSKELRYVMEKAARHADSKIGEAMLIRNYTLAFSVFEIDGNPISVIIGTDKIEEKVKIIDEFEELITAKLWKAYSSMIDSGSKDTDLGSTAEEIVDNVKKS